MELLENAKRLFGLAVINQPSRTFDHEGQAAEDHDRRDDLEQLGQAPVKGAIEIVQAD
jgi:hypothetical protein